MLSFEKNLLQLQQVTLYGKMSPIMLKIGGKHHNTIPNKW